MSSVLKEYQALSIEWRQAINNHLDHSLVQRLDSFVSDERRSTEVYPAAGEVFTALQLCPLPKTRVVILGQDPYHGPQQAHGLSFSVRASIKRLPPSLRNIYKEREADLEIEPRESGELSDWAIQGVLLLNTVLTVRRGEAHSHKRRGWEAVTDAIIQAVSVQSSLTVFQIYGTFGWNTK